MYKQNKRWEWYIGDSTSTENQVYLTGTPKIVAATIREAIILIIMAIEGKICAYRYQTEQSMPGFKLYFAIVMMPALAGFFGQCKFYISMWQGRR